MSSPIYVPIFRGKQEEQKVLESFDFGECIYPCIEIIKECNRQLPDAMPLLVRKKNFASHYIRLLNNINAKHVFVDLPVHLERSNLKKVHQEFLTRVVVNRKVRTEFIKELTNPRRKVIPVISTYWEINNETNSIILQEADLRTDFNTLAFRTFPESFNRDIKQIVDVFKPNDYLIMDWGDMELDLNDGDQQDILSKLREHNLENVIVHRNPFPKGLTIVGLKHNEYIELIDNSHIKKYTWFLGTSFSDYAGIKKDNLEGGGVTSPGFIYYDATENSFYGFRFKKGGHKKNQIRPNIAEFETTIVPDVIVSLPTKRMNEDELDFLGEGNYGWTLLNEIDNRETSGKNAAKFKLISMEHYLHCIRTKIENRDFD